MENINDFSFRSLSKQDIHVLRDMARYLGVASPTSKKKEQLISDILDIVYGKAMPQYKNVNRGRPAKNAVNYDSPNYEFGGLMPNLQVASPGQNYSVDYIEASMRGVLVYEDGQYYIRKFKFVSSLGDIKLTRKEVVDKGLKENDVINYRRVNGKVEILSHTSPNSTTKLTEYKSLLRGKRNLVYVSCLQDKQRLLAALSDVDTCLFIPSNSVSRFAGNNLTIMPCNYSNESELLNSFFASCDVANFYSGQGQTVALVCDNILNIVSALKQYDEPQAEQLERQVLVCIERLIANNITFVALIPQIIKNAINNISDLFDSIVSI